jgi:hypothetical protein
LNLFTEELGHNMNPGMIVLEKLDLGHKRCFFLPTKINLGLLAGQIAVDPQ